MKVKYENMTALAEAIGVSRPTLSKYFHDPTNLRDSSRLKIERALKNVDYVPNFFARNLNRKSTKLFGFIVPHLNDLFYTSLIEAVEDQAFMHGYRLLVQNAHNDADREMEALETLRSMNADGVIIAPVGNSIDAAALKRISVDLPIVFVDAPIEELSEEYPFVGTNNQQSITLLVDYLCRSGNPPAFLGMPEVNSNSSERQTVYIERMTQLGLEPRIIEAAERDEAWDFEEYAYNTMSSHFRQGKYIEDTILCASDRLAFGVLKAAHEAKLWEPNNSSSSLRIAGHDNYPLSAFISPGLTTVSQDTNVLGQRVFEILIREATRRSTPGTRFPKELIDGRLVIRASA